MKTRDRIVATALSLFNQHGYGAVSTAMLAQACGIAEGNLWYHFKTRAALLDAIGDQFAAAIESRLAMRPGADPVGDYARMLAAVMAEFRHFRFFYRDQTAYGQDAAIVWDNAPRWLEMTFDQVEAYLTALVEADMLDWPRERLRDLAINATIILRYGLEHYRELGEPIAAGEGAVRRTLRRHLTLFEHRLAGDVALRLNSAIDAIEAEPLAA